VSVHVLEFDASPDTSRDNTRRYLAGSRSFASCGKRVIQAGLADAAICDRNQETLRKEGRRFESCQAHSVCSNRAATQTNILKTWENRRAENVRICRISAKLRNFLQNVALPDKEEAPSSSPGRPPLRFPFVFRESASEAVSAARCPFAFATYVQLLETAYGEKGAWGPRRKRRYVAGSNHCPFHLRDP
jgi:hypothetical protein